MAVVTAVSGAMLSAITSTTGFIIFVLMVAFFFRTVYLNKKEQEYQHKFSMLTTDYEELKGRYKASQESNNSSYYENEMEKLEDEIEKYREVLRTVASVLTTYDKTGRSMPGNCLEVLRESLAELKGKMKVKV